MTDDPRDLAEILKWISIAAALILAAAVFSCFERSNAPLTPRSSPASDRS